MTSRKIPRVLKIERARHHLEELSKTVREVISEDNQTVIFKPDPRIPGNYLIKIKFKSLAPQLPLIAGDAVQNLRAGLDHIALALANKHSGSTISNDDERNSQFPIIGDASKQGKSGMGPQIWASISGKMIGMASQEAQSIIQGLQPYQLGKGYFSHPLWALNELANRDKHRVLNMVQGVLENLEIDHGGLVNCRLGDSGQIVSLGRSVNGETEIASIPIEKIDPDQPFGLNLNFHLRVYFPDVVPTGVDAIGTLWEIHKYITEEVIPPLAPHM